MKRIILSFFLVISTFWSTTTSNAESNFSECLLDASKYSSVSLGKPLASERLGNKSKVRVGVLPFYFTDDSVKILNNEEKSDYEEAVLRIEKISNQKVDIELVFYPSINSGKKTSELKSLSLQNADGWNQRDLKKSTWGFVKDLILKADKVNNFSNLDSIVIEGSNIDGSYRIAEAMMFSRPETNNVFQDANLDFFSAVKTEEGYIDNAVLLDRHKGASTIAHEILHNFGLTDLYGSGSGPGPFSLMAGGSSRILNIERATLGWFPVSQFRCTNLDEVFNELNAANRITLENVKEDSIWLFKISQNSAYVLEVMNYDKKSLLALYFIEQDRRPPLTFFYDPNFIYANLFDVSSPEYIGSFYEALDFNLLIDKLEGNRLHLILIPRKLIKSKDAIDLFEQSKQERVREIANRVLEKAEADAKTKAEADAKTKAEADAKSKAVKRTSIKCTKGKLIKKITAVNPKCPVGYKKK